MNGVSSQKIGVLYLVRNVLILTSVEMAPVADFKSSHSLLWGKWGSWLAAGSVKAARRVCARRRVALTGSAASSTIVPRGNGSFPFQKRGHFYRGEKGTFSSRDNIDTFTRVLYLDRNIPYGQNTGT